MLVSDNKVEDSDRWISGRALDSYYSGCICCSVEGENMEMSPSKLMSLRISLYVALVLICIHTTE